MKGLFITFEGGEGSGKTTVIRMVNEYLINKGYVTCPTREPGGVNIAEQIRNVILDVNNTEMNPKTEAILYAASRIEHLDKKVIPALSRGEIVLCDRYLDSSLVYQGHARGLGMENVEKINMFALDNMPNITFFFDIKQNVALERIKNNHREQNRLDKEAIDFHNKVYEGYNILCDMYPNRVVRINSNQSVSDVFNDVIKVLEGWLRVR